MGIASIENKIRKMQNQINAHRCVNPNTKQQLNTTNKIQEIKIITHLYIYMNLNIY